jgi:hypothetical protein
MVVRFVYIGGIVDHYCLNSLFITVSYKGLDTFLSSLLADINRLMRSSPSQLNNWISNYNTDINKSTIIIDGSSSLFIRSELS